MKTRLAGVVLVLIGVITAWVFGYLPLRDGTTGSVGPVRLKALVFIPLATITGLALALGGPRVLGAFQARPKSRGQLALVLGIIIGSGVLTGLAYWQLTTRWAPAPRQDVIRDFRPQVPRVAQPQLPQATVPRG